MNCKNKIKWINFFILLMAIALIATVVKLGFLINDTRIQEIPKYTIGQECKVFHNPVMISESFTNKKNDVRYIVRTETLIEITVKEKELNCK